MSEYILSVSAVQSHYALMYELDLFCANTLTELENRYANRKENLKQHRGLG